MDRREVHKEVFLLWIITLLLIKLVVVGRGAGLPEIILVLVPILFMYMPVGMCWLRGVDSFDYPLALPAFSDFKTWGEALKLNATIIGIIAVPWIVGYHLWYTILFDKSPTWAWPPEGPLMVVGYHFFFVAIPEEFFYRGYLQTRLDEAYGVSWTIFGARLGWGWIITCVVFAVGHSLVDFQWWHFAIFFPSLIFGWMRARTGGIIAGAMFHAWANITVSILDASYGITDVPLP